MINLHVTILLISFPALVMLIKTHNNNSKMCWQVSRSIFPSCLSICRQKNPEPIILRVPIELLIEIFSHLELPGQVCFAMSCKGLYQLFGSVLQADELCFPRLSSRKGRAKKYHRRMTLLTQLEDSRWACCAVCQKLHPRKEFALFYLSEHPRQRKCMSWAGLVDLCPCITLTPHDRNHIVEYLMGKASDKMNVVNSGVWKSSHNDKGKQCVSHECRAYSMAKVNMALSLSNDSQLVVCTQYELPLTAPRMTSIYICPHSNFYHCIFGTSQLSPGNVWNCTSCHTCLVNLTEPRTPEVIVAVVMRYLGKGIWPKTGFHEDWYRQSRFWSDYIL